MTPSPVEKVSEKHANKGIDRPCGEVPQSLAVVVDPARTGTAHPPRGSTVARSARPGPCARPTPPRAPSRRHSAPDHPPLRHDPGCAHDEAPSPGPPSRLRALRPPARGNRGVPPEAGERGHAPGGSRPRGLRALPEAPTGRAGTRTSPRIPTDWTDGHLAAGGCVGALVGRYGSRITRRGGSPSTARTPPCPSRATAASRTTGCGHSTGGCGGWVRPGRRRRPRPHRPRR